jgi:hypothetical protein
MYEEFEDTKEVIRIFYFLFRSIPVLCMKKPNKDWITQNYIKKKVERI